MRVVALLTVRNEELFLTQCLEHLYSQGIETCLIDNGSTDRTLEIAKSFLNKGVLRIEQLPFTGYFELSAILENEEKLASEIDADWFIHHDADEIRQAPQPYKTLYEGIEDADRQGYNAINFEEFVFLPTSEDESFESKDYVQEMRYYYFFQPSLFRRLNAWKNLKVAVNLSNSGGHHVEFEGQRIFPVQFILRHYIVLSRAHALRKYAGRVHSIKEAVERGWQRERASFTPAQLTFPSRDRLKLVSDDNSWDKSEPWLRHEFLGDRPFLTNQLPTVKDEQTQDQRKNWQEKLLVFWRKRKPSTYPPMPIIVGVGRSGTTLLRLMLDAHPELSIPPETHFLASVTQLKSEGDILRNELYNTVVNVQSWGDFHLSPEDFYNKLKAIEPFNLADGLRCFYKMYAQRFNKPRWGDKTPPYLEYMSFIQATLPEAYFIHVIRDGRDVALSRKGLWFGPGNDIEAQATDWLWRIREARQQAQSCQHYLEIHYEDLITDTKSVLKEICQFIDLPYTKNLEKYYHSAKNRLDEFVGWHRSDGSVWATKEQFKEIHKLTQSPPDQTRIGRWRSEMSDEDRAKFEAIAGSMLRELGYET